MKKKYMLITGIVVLLILCVFCIYNLTHYYVDIDDKEEVVSIRYNCGGSGDVYELSDSELVNEFMNELENIKFKYSETHFIPSYMSFLHFYNEDGELVDKLGLYHDSSIMLVGETIWFEFVGDAVIDTNIFEESGVWIKNMHD